MSMETKLPFTTLCHIERDNAWLMMHRTTKKKDVNEGKWIGVGGHFKAKESPEECLLREVKEETGLTLTSWKFRGILTFEWEPAPSSENEQMLQPESEYICVYTADSFEGDLIPCDEGELAWIPKEEVLYLNLWAGDRIFLRMLLDDEPFFSLKLCYQGDDLTFAALNGRTLAISDIV